MAISKMKKIRRWVTRILLFLILFPLGTLFIVRTAGLFKMRKADGEIMSFLKQHHVAGEIGKITFHGRRIVYLKTMSGDKKKDAFLFVHGSPGSMDAFLDYMVDTNLLSHADLIVYDRPGFGNSGFGKSMTSLTMQAQTVSALMDSLGYERYWMAGHSYGGPIIIQAAMDHPRHIGGICLIAGSVSPELEPRSPWRKWIDLPLVRQLLPTSMRVSNEELMPLRQDLVMIEDDWEKIKIPVLLMQGTKDVLVPFANLAYAKDKLTQSDSVMVKIFEGENHFILWTQKEVVVEELIRLVQTSSGDKTGKHALESKEH
jgi:pimeloyl-ACP methyl ester carboxylesterase